MKIKVLYLMLAAAIGLSTSAAAAVFTDTWGDFVSNQGNGWGTTFTPAKGTLAGNVPGPLPQTLYLTDWIFAKSSSSSGMTAGHTYLAIFSATTVANMNNATLVAVSRNWVDTVAIPASGQMKWQFDCVALDKDTQYALMFSSTPDHKGIKMSQGVELEVGNLYAYGGFIRVDEVTNEWDPDFVATYSTSIIPMPASEPVPADDAVDVPPDAVLSWSMDNTPPDITGHYVYFGENEALVTARDAGVYRGLQGKTDLDYIPAGMVIDKEYFWAVDESVLNSAPTNDANTVAGPVWSFKTLRTLPDISRQPQDVLAIAGRDAGFNMEVYNPVTGDATGLTYAWKAVGSSTVLSTDAVFVIYNAGASDAGEYYCTVTNTNGSRDSEPASLSVTKAVVSWEFDETSGLTAADSSGNGITGTVGYKGVWTANGGQSGKAGDNALYLPGDPNAFVNALGVDLTGKPVNNIFLGTSSWTLNVWVKLDGYANLHNIAGFGDCGWSGVAGYSDRYFATLGNNTLRFLYGDNGFFPGSWLNIGQWQMMTLTYDAAAKTGAIYLNGTVRQTQTNLTLVNTDENAFKINSSLQVYGVGMPFPLKGLVDDFCVYDEALTADRVLYLYQGYVCSAPLGVADVNGDCRVNMEDVALVAQSWLASERYPAE